MRPTERQQPARHQELVTRLREREHRHARHERLVRRVHPAVRDGDRGPSKDCPLRDRRAQHHIGGHRPSSSGSTLRPTDMTRLHGWSAHPGRKHQAEARPDFRPRSPGGPATRREATTTRQACRPSRSCPPSASSARTRPHRRDHPHQTQRTTENVARGAIVDVMALTVSGGGTPARAAEINNDPTEPLCAGTQSQQPPPGTSRLRATATRPARPRPLPSLQPR